MGPYIFLIIVYIFTSVPPSFPVERKQLLSSKFFGYYKNYIKNSSELEPYIKSITNGITSLDETTGYASLYRVLRTSLKILSDDSYDPLIYLMVNTKGLKKDIWTTSIFTYLLVTHVYRVYNYCTQEDYLNKLLSKDCPSTEDLYLHYAKILSPIYNTLEPTFYGSVEMKIRELVNDIVPTCIARLKCLFTSGLYTHTKEYCERLFDIEMKYIVCSALEFLDCKNRWEVCMREDLTKIKYNIHLLNLCRGKIIIFTKGNLMETVIKENRSKMRFNVYNEYPFRNLNYSPTFTPRKEYFLDLDNMKKIIGQWIIVDRDWIEVYFSLLLYYSAVHSEVFVIEVVDWISHSEFIMVVKYLDRNTFETEINARFSRANSSGN